MANIDSILNSVKKLLGIAIEDTTFDDDIIMHINSAIVILTQNGIGPSEGFVVTDPDTKWINFVSDPIMAHSISTFVYSKVRLIFDPPASPTIVEALKSTSDECLWRLRYWAENK